MQFAHEGKVKANTGGSEGTLCLFLAEKNSSWYGGIPVYRARVELRSLFVINTENGVSLL